MTTEYLLDREVERVLAALMPQNQLIMRMVLRNGMRLSDALEFRTDRLALCGWYVEKKTGKRRRFGLDARLLADIRAGRMSSGRRRRSDCGRMWPRTASARPTPSSSWRSTGILRRCGGTSTTPAPASPPSTPFRTCSWSGG